VAAAYVKQVAGAAASAASATVTATVTAPSAAGNAIIVACSNSQSSGTINTCTDTKGNTYVQVVNDKHATATVQDAIFIARNATALTTSDTITVTVSVSTGLPALAAFEFSGLTGASDALVQGQGGNNSAYDTGAGTVPAGGHLLFSIAAGTGNRTFTPTGSGTWTALPKTPAPPSSIRTGNPFYQVVTGGGVLENVGTIDANCNWVTSAAAFPAGSSGTAATATGTVSLAGTATAKATAIGAGSVALAGAGAARASASAAGAVALAGAATGAASDWNPATVWNPADPWPGPDSGTLGPRATGSITLAATVTANAKAAAGGGITLAGTGTGRAVGAATGVIVINGSGTAKAVAVASGAIVLGGTVAGIAAAAAGGVITLSGTGVGAIPITYFPHTYVLAPLLNNGVSTAVLAGSASTAPLASSGVSTAPLLNNGASTAPVNTTT